MFQVESKKEMWHDLCQRPLAFRAATNKHVESGLSDKLCQHKDTRAVIFSALNECLIHTDANPSATLCCRRKGYITHYFRTRLYGKEKKIHLHCLTVCSDKFELLAGVLPLPLQLPDTLLLGLQRLQEPRRTDPLRQNDRNATPPHWD